MIAQTPLGTLIGWTTREYFAQNVSANRPDGFADETGFHLYGQLGLTLKLSAAEDPRDAQKLLEILQEYTLLAEICAGHVGAYLLEVQGKRIHLFLPAQHVSRESVTRVIEFAHAFTKTVYARIGARAGDSFKGFHMAGDHGRAIIIKAGSQANGSIISLGPAANEPAKQLNKVSTGHLRLRSEHAIYVTGKKTPVTWEDINVLEPSSTIQSSGKLATAFEQMTMKVMDDVSQNLPRVRYGSADYLQTVSGSVSDPVKLRGFFMRADLDGFSAQVREAFAEAERRGNDEPIRALVERFVAILKYPKSFQTRIGRTIELPFSGDCANIVIPVFAETYELAREYMPAKAAAEWHSQIGFEVSEKRKWTDVFGGARWAVGIAGGDGEEGCDGVILVAALKGKNRDFLVAAGWSVGRSLDAQESDGVTADDTVIPDVDYDALDSVHQKNFRQHGTLFWISHGLTAEKLKERTAAVLTAAATVPVPNVFRPLPSPRPYAGD